MFLSLHDFIITGKISLSTAEELLLAIVDNSEVEDLSNGEEDDPAVNKIIPNFDDSPPESSKFGDEEDDDYLPPDAAEDSDSQSET